MSKTTWRDSTLPPMTQLVAFCDWERKHNPPPPGGQHIAEWAVEEIERLQRVKYDYEDQNNALRGALAQKALEILRIEELCRKQEQALAEAARLMRELNEEAGRLLDGVEHNGVLR